MGKRITLRDVAGAAGVHLSSVSMALRNHPRIGKATRERIQRIAEEMGYRPDPGLSALAAYRSGLRPAEGRGEIGLIGLNLPGAPTAVTTTGAVVLGLRERAERLGYSIPSFDLKDPALTPRRLNGILRARNIQGVILTRMDLRRVEFLRKIDWNDITAVGLGRWPAFPPVPRIEHNQYATMQTILHRMLRRGYRRIGLVHNFRNLKGISFYPEAAYLQTLTRSRFAEPHPVFYLDRRPVEEFEEWAEANRLDAVISNLEPAALLRGNDYGDLFPQRYGFACLNLHTFDGSVAGVNQHLDLLGGRAVDVVVAQIQRGDRGFPPVTSHILIDGSWEEGATLPGYCPPQGPPLQARRKIVGNLAQSAAPAGA